MEYKKVLKLTFFVLFLNSIYIYSGPLSGKRITLSPGHGWVWDPWNSGAGWATERENDPEYPEDMTNHLLARHVKRYLEEAGAVVLPCRDMGPGMNEIAGDNWRGPNRSLVTVAPNKPRWQMSARYYFYANPYGENVISLVYDTPYSTTESGKSLRSRPYYANWNMKEKGGCDMYISCHTNAVSDTSVRGTVVLHDNDSDSTDCYDYDGGDMSTHTVNIQNSLTFANLLAQKILYIMQKYWDPTWKFQSGFPTGVWSATWKWFETRGPQMPNALIEYAFHTNPYEEECIITGTYQGRELPCRKREPWRSLMAQATYKAVCDYFGVPYDLPSQVTDLTAVPGCNPGEIILTWTAPGEDGDYVKAASYTVRYALSSFTESEFDSKTLLIQNWFPQERYKTETKLLTGFVPGVTYYFALKATNDTADTSKMSNLASCWAQTITTQLIYAKIYGYIKNKQGDVIQGTMVELVKSTTTIQQTIASSGYYEFLLYPLSNYIGTYNIVCSSSVYAITVETVTVTTDNPLVYKDIILHSLGSLVVTVKNSITNNVIPQSIVSISPKNLSAVADVNGQVVFQQLTADTYTVTVTSAGYFQQRVSVWVQIDTTTYITVYLTPVSNIYVTVKDGYTNSAINQASCILNPGNVYSLTNAQGQVSYVGLSSGSYTLTVYKTGYSTVTLNIELAVGENKNLVVNLIPTSFVGVVVSTITGIVKDVSGNVLDNVSVGLVKEGTILSQDITNDQGRFVFYGVSTGTYSLYFAKEGYVSYSTTVVITISEIVDLSITLEKEILVGYKIYGYVKTKNTNVSISSATVKLLPVNITVYTDTNGYFEFTNIDSGNYELVVNKNGYKEEHKNVVVTETSINLGDIYLVPYKTLEIVSPERKINIVTKENAKVYFSISPTESVSVKDVEAKIVDLHGMVVRSGSDIVKIVDGQGVIEWDYKDNSGRKVPSGIYFYYIKIANKVSTGKIVVLR